jgi:alkanesulfonate monooxygenase SsuD/methylene tetrahydromethanopterin reductase-like flavin-dependent oxidoreductase (luciferase family)
MLSRSCVGSPATIGPQLDHFVEETGIDELMAASAIYDNTARLRSYKILATTGVRESKQMAVNEVTTPAYWGASATG